MNERYRIHIVDSDPRAGSLAQPCQEAGFAIGATHPSLEAILDSSATPDVIVLDSATAGGTPAVGVRLLLQRWPAACVIVTGGTPATVSHAVAAGARGFLLKPYNAGDLCAVIRESFESAQLLGRGPRSHGRIVALYSPKGGAGCSTIAVNLAVLSAARPHTSVALIDLDLQFGDLAVMLDLRSPNSIVDLVGHAELDSALVNDTFVRHASGVRVLPAPTDLASVASIDPAKVERTLAALRDHFDLIVCDLWTSLDDLTTRVLRSADAVILVTKPEVPALKSMSRVLSARDLNLDLEEAIVVANRLPTRGGPSGGEIERSLAHPISVAIPSDGLAVVDAINRGIPVVDPRIRTRVQQPFRDLVAAVWRALEGTRTAERETALAPA